MCEDIAVKRVKELEAEVERLRVDLEASNAHIRDCQERLESECADVGADGDVLVGIASLADERDEWKAKAEANAAAAHALEVIEREHLGVTWWQNSNGDLWEVTHPDLCDIDNDFTGPTIIDAVKAYEQRKTKETK